MKAAMMLLVDRGAEAVVTQSFCCGDGRKQAALDPQGVSGQAARRPSGFWSPMTCFRDALT